MLLFLQRKRELSLPTIHTGREMLVKLQKKNPDSAIVAALQKLELDEKNRQTKANAQMRKLTLCARYPYYSRLKSAG